MALKPGETLFHGQYRILRMLGRGGFGFVYEAQDTLLSEQVAIKELIPALVGDDVVLKRFLAEAKATKRLRHKRIVATHNVFQEGGNYYFVMEMMPGGSLEARLKEQGALPVEEAVHIAAEVCEGLACAHEEGVVHCDLKPANILFDNKGEAKVADFGIAHVSEQILSRSWQTPSGFVAGTLPYMSPEQTDGVRDDPRVDVYALGAVLYRMLTGRTYVDFDPRETPRAQAENVQRIYAQKPAAPSTHNRRVPSWLDEVILRALAKRPEERYPNAGELRTALLLRGAAVRPIAQPAPSETVAVPPRTVPRAPATRARRIPPPPWFWPLSGVAGILLLVIATAVVALVGDRGDARKTLSPEPSKPIVAIVADTPASQQTTFTPFPTGKPTASPRPTLTPSPTNTATAAPTLMLTPSSTRVATATPTPTWTASSTRVATATLAPTRTSSPTSAPTATRSPTPTYTQTSIPSPSLRSSPTATQQARPSATAAPPSPEQRLDSRYDRYLYVTDLASGASVSIFGGTGYYWLSSAAWSPNGNKILVSVIEYSEQAASGHRGPDGHRVTTISREGNDETVVKRMVGSFNEARAMGAAIWSPDGQRIAVRYQYGADYGIFTMKPNGTAWQRVAGSEAGDYPRFWSTDGKWIIATSSAGGPLVALELDGSRRVPLSQLGKIQVYDERFYPWRITSQPRCPESPDYYDEVEWFWNCE